MFYDSKEIQDKKVVEADLCIIGGGAAGITLAREMIGLPLQVCLLESGGFDFDLDTQNLYQGASTGYDNYPVDASRMRFLGGTTNHWNGNIWPLFPDDFEQRDWIPDSGWPISREMLDAYYPKAAEVVQIKGPYSWDLDELKHYIQPVFYDPRLIENTMLDRAVFQHSPPTRFGQVYRSELERAENVHVYLWANAVGFDTDPQGVRVTGIPVKTLNGLTFTVKARYYVLSAGSIENARLLLLSNQSVRAGLGNQHDVVGRYFNDHPMARIGKIVFADVGEALEGPPKSKGIRGVLTLSTAGMREKKVARVMGMVSPVSKMTTRQALSYFWKTSKRIWNNEEDLTEKIASVTSAMGRLQNDLGAIHGWSDTQAAYLDVVIEQLPCRDSRVTLSDEVDALGLPKVVLDWRFVPEQEELTQRAFQLMAEQIGASGLGRMQITESLSFANPSAFLFRSSFHHMGTTRMGTDPSISVVDPNSRVHTVDNLYIAGSSVFPTTGVSNPTLTIVAMTLRLAEHLKAKLV